jgi:hypothetical protein
MKNLTLVVVMLGIIVLVDVIGIVVLALQSMTIPDVLPTIAVAGVTGIVGLLVRPDAPPAA